MLVCRKLPAGRLLVVGLLVAVISPTAAWSGCRGVTLRRTADFGTRGPHGVGARTLRLVDETRPTPPNGSFPGVPYRALDIEVWYPATVTAGPTVERDAPLDASGAPYPIILYGHALQD